MFKISQDDFLALQHNNDVIYRTNPVFVFNLLLIPYN